MKPEEDAREAKKPADVERLREELKKTDTSNVAISPSQYEPPQLKPVDNQFTG